MSEKQPLDMNTFLLQIKGDASFSLFSQVTDVESLNETWKLCSKVASHLEEGKRLENLSWRLFHLHAMMAAESTHDKTRTFERLSKETGKQLDRERHLGLSQLQAPPLKSGRRVSQPMTSVSATIHHPTLLCSLSSPITENGTGGIVNCTTITSSTHINISTPYAWDFDFKTGPINFDSLLSSFSPLAVLSTVDYVSQGVNIPENECMRIEDSDAAWDSANYLSWNGQTDENLFFTNKVDEESSPKFEIVQQVANTSDENNPSSSSIDCVLSEPVFENHWEAHEESPKRQIQFMSQTLPLDNEITFQKPHGSDHSQGQLPASEMNVAPTLSGARTTMAQGNTEFFMKIPYDPDLQTNLKTEKVGEKRKRRNPMATRLPKFVGVPAPPERPPDDSLAEKSICFNCRGTHTPLWRRGPNDEILCNACGVFYKVHKRHRPPSLGKCKFLVNSNANAETTSKGTEIQCTNCNAESTPMWRKAPNGSLLCNACALYYKCHKRPRPASCSKPAASRPSIVNRLSNFDCTKDTSLRITSPSFEMYNNHPSIPRGPNNPLIDSLDKGLDGRNYFNQPHEFDFFQTYPDCFFTSSNV